MSSAAVCIDGGSCSHGKCIKLPMSFKVLLLMFIKVVVMISELMLLLYQKRKEDEVCTLGLTLCFVRFIEL